ncbi:MAG TPA: fimbria/pilus outer membrane usher protein [Hyphomicrobium sp.]|nr:fimbria/pilus outer membrane usher protein [Hyphomicrobium sp.]
MHTKTGRGREHQGRKASIGRLLLSIARNPRCPGSGIQVAVLVIVATAISVPGYTAYAAGVEYATPISTRLNTTGRPIDMDVPMEGDGRELGDIPIRINADDSIMVSRAALIQAVSASLDATARTHLAAIGGDAPFIPLPAFVSAGFDIRFDRALQELTFTVTPGQRATSDISLSGNRQSRVSSVLATPAKLSGYVNLFASLDHEWGMHSSGEDFESATSGRLEFDSAVRAGNFVIENAGVLAGDVDVNVCPTVALCAYTHSPGFKRQMSRLVYDMPEDRIRTEVGDVEPLGTSFQSTPDLLGVSIEKSSRKLSPGDTFAPTGSGSFVVNRPSDVEIRINGVVQRRIQLRPGTYNVRDLPLVTGANDVDIVIIDDTGKQQHISFTSFYDTSLLAAGKSEWGLTAGLPSYLRDEARDYLPDFYMASGFYRYGLRDNLVGELDLQADARVVMAGAGILTDFASGLIGMRGAASVGDSGSGMAVGLDWSTTNFHEFTQGGGESIRLAAEYRSPDFRTAGDIDTALTGIIYPQWNYWLNLNATYSAPIGYGTTASFSTRYQFVNDEEFGSTLFASGNRYGADVTFSRPLTAAMSGSLTLGVSNESYLSTLDPREPTGPEFRVGFRLFGNPDERTNISTGYDTLNEQSDVSAYRSSGNGIGRWDTSVNVQQNEFDDRASVNGMIGYYGNRAQVRLIHNSGFDGVSITDFHLQPGQQRTSLQVGTSIAFADGHVAIGAPITGDAYAIVYPHESIADKTVTVGSNDNVRAVADGWGPAVVTNLPAYAPSTIPVDADDLPIGYSLGAAAFDTFAPFKGGYALEVGSAYSVSAYGTLQFTDGEPVALLMGTARPIDHPDKSVTIFTNAAGRFGAEGLAPGRWILEMATDGAPTRFALNIPSNVEGLFKAGTLHPVGAP